MFALLIVPLLAIAAFAIDASQWQVGANQLQTVADASALAGARGAQLYGTQAQAVAYASTAGGANTAFGSAVTVASSDVEPAFFNPATKVVTLTGVTWSTYNAVKVTVRSTGRRTFSGVAMSSAPQVTRSAVAWIANVNSAECIKPWALPYIRLYDIAAAAAVAQGQTVPSPVTTPRPNLTPGMINAINTASIADRTVVLYGPQNPVPAGSPSNYDQWTGYDYSGNSGNPGFQTNIYSCDNTVVTVGVPSGNTMPGGASYECWSVRAILGNTQNTCQSNNNNWTTSTGPNAQTCFFPVMTTSGTVNTYHAECNALNNIWVTWGDLTGTGSNALNYREIGKFALGCVFRGLSTVQGFTGNSGTINETCTLGGITYTNLPVGTIIGVIQGLSSVTLTTPGITLGNVASDVQRLILVQ